MFQQLLETICYRYLALHVPPKSSSAEDVETWFQTRDSHMFSYLSWGHIIALDWREVAVCISQSTVKVDEVSAENPTFRACDMLHVLLHKLVTRASYPLLKGVLRKEGSREHVDLVLDPVKFLWLGNTGPTFVVPKRADTVILASGNSVMLRNSKVYLYGHAKEAACVDGIYEMAFPETRAVLQAAFIGECSNAHSFPDFSTVWELWYALTNGSLVLAEYTPGNNSQIDSVIHLLQQAKIEKIALPVSAQDLQELMEDRSDHSQE